MQHRLRSASAPAISTAQIAASAPTPNWSRLAQLATHLGGVSGALLWQVVNGRALLRGAFGLPAAAHEQALDLCVQVAPDARPEGAMLDADRHPTLCTHGLVVGPQRIRFCLILCAPESAAAQPQATQPCLRLALLDPAARTQSDADALRPALHVLLAHAASLQESVSPPPALAPPSAGGADKSWHESASRLQLIERTAGVGSWSIHSVSGQVQHSDECARILGLQAGEELTDLESMVQRYTPEWRSNMRHWLRRCAQSGAAFDAEVQLLVPGAGPKWVRTVGHAVHHAGGQILRIQGAVQDITAHKQAQQETLRLAMRLTTTLASITEAFVTLDRQCCYTYLNQESERLLQKTTAELLGQEVWHGLGSGLAQRLREQLDKALQTNHRVELEEHFPALGRWLEVRAYPFAEGLAVYFRDVTERRRSQEQLMLLETGVSRLNDIVAIAEADVNTRKEPCIVFVNDAFERQTGYTRAEVLGQTPRRLRELDLPLAKLRNLALGLQQHHQARTELMVRRKNGESFWVELEVVSVQVGADDVTHWVMVGRDITQRKNAEDMIRHMALYDPLTDLPNRQLLVEKLHQTLLQSARTGQHGALMFIDLDHFKIINDTLGHHVGDELLKRVADRLVQSVRKTDTVARLGGDEFVVMVDDLSTDADAATFKARALAEKVLHMLREPFQIAGHPHFATPSIGITSFCRGHADVSELLKQADLAMYQAKSRGRNSVCFFDPAMQATVSSSAALGVALRVALREEQFVLHYQPQVNRQGVVTAVEALVRWRHPERGLMQPADFIPVAEDNGLILPLGQWVLQAACEQLAVWADAAQTAGLCIAVNVSVHQFRHPEFVDMVMAAIERTGIRAHRLNLELTESLLVEGMEVTIQKMGLLKALGVRLSLDDFGVGYSSLSCLKRLPLNQIKIDRGFVAGVLTDRHDAAIARTVIALAQSLGLQVVAEGVETQAQRDFLAAQGCDQFQGHLFAPALPIEALNEFLRNPSADPLASS